MMYDLIEVTPKMNKKKVAIVVAIAILVVGICVLAGIYFAKAHHKSEQVENVVEDKAKEVVSTEKEKLKHIAQVNFNPTYTDIREKLDGKYI